MKGIQVRKGAILLWRLGQLTYGEQSAWDRAPQEKGMWAFPWPFYDSSFTEHQYSYYMPKRLKTGGYGDPLDTSWYCYPDGSKPETVVLDEYGYPEDPNLDVPQAFWDARNAWISTVGKRVLPLRKFWYEGDLFTHFPRIGLEVTDYGYSWDLLETWHRVSSEEAARRLQKGAGQLGAVAQRPGRLPRRGSVGSLELFLTPGAGRIS